MSVPENDRAIVESYARAMQAGQAGAADLVALFADDAVYMEPWSTMTSHTEIVGRASIAAWFTESLAKMPADFTLTINRLDLEGDTVRSDWTCTSAVFPGPMQGHDLFTIRDGKIARLETYLSMPANHGGEW